VEAALNLVLAVLAARPTLAAEATYGVPGGRILVHYATTGGDAASMAFVEEVATTAEAAHAQLVAAGFRAPLDDGTLGGDSRIDIYLRDLQSADGNAGTDSCVGDRCIGFISAENDFAGYGYSSITEGIRSVVPHELFHLIQNAYSSAEPSTWTEGSAVWAVEHLYGADNSDFERFLPSFLTRSYRPFERTAGGFGDGYPYGAALWPYFLEQRFGVQTVVAAWAGCETAPFLDAADTALAAESSSLDAAWAEMTRWNAFTGARASRGGYLEATKWSETPREPTLTASGTAYIEGLSARYVPLELATRAQLTVTSASKIAAWVVPTAGTLDDGIEVTADTVLEPGSYLLVISGLARNSITTAVDIGISEPDEGGGGCSSSSPTGSGLAMLALLRMRRRARPRPRRPPDMPRPDARRSS